MSVSEIQFLITEQPFLWLALAAVLGVLIGLRIGRWLERAKSTKVATAADSAHEGDTGFEDPAGQSTEAGFREETIEAEDSSGLSSAEFKISHLVGMVDKHVKALASHGIASVADLREATSTKKAREQLADDLQLEDFVVNKWARMVDFLKLENMTPETAEFLVFAGINSTGDLASRNPESVAHKLQSLNEKEARIDQTPSRQQLEAWIAALNN